MMVPRYAIYNPTAQDPFRVYAATAASTNHPSVQVQLDQGDLAFLRPRITSLKDALNLALATGFDSRDENATLPSHIMGDPNAETILKKYQMAGISLAGAATPQPVANQSVIAEGAL